MTGNLFYTFLGTLSKETISRHFLKQPGNEHCCVPAEECRYDWQLLVAVKETLFPTGSSSFYSISILIFFQNFVSNRIATINCVDNVTISPDFSSHFFQ